jgi:hypothetical protein
MEEQIGKRNTKSSYVNLKEQVLGIIKQPKG